ncbi:ion channel [Francisellaceae bacterium]|nr:ion channel [Francisellaceae bacterium]
MANIIPRVISILVIINGSLYTLEGILFLERTPDLDKAIKYLGTVDIFHQQNYTNGFSLLFGSMGILIGIGLFKRHKMAWFWSTVFLGVTISINLFTWHITRTFYYSVFAFVLLLLTYRSFDRESDKQTYVLLSIIFSLGYGIIGTYMLKEGFNGVNTWIDALYFTIVTYSTVGYGDITPTSDIARLFTCTMILIGLSTFATAISVYFGPMLTEKFQNIQKHLAGNHLHHHEKNPNSHNEHTNNPENKK